MKGRTPSGRRPRGSLSPESIVEAAIAFVEENSLQQLSMLALSREMGLPASSIHWHFRTRQELVDRVALEVTVQLMDAMPRGDDDLPWDEQLTTWFTELRHQFLERPNLFDLPVDRSLLLSNPTVGRRIKQRVDHIIAVLTEAGLTTENAYEIYHLCGVFTRGFVRVELSDAYHPDSPSSDGALASIATDDDVELLTGVRESSDRQFELGLRVLVAGIRATMIDGSKRTKVASRKR